MQFCGLPIVIRVLFWPNMHCYRCFFLSHPCCCLNFVSRWDCNKLPYYIFWKPSPSVMLRCPLILVSIDFWIILFLTAVIITWIHAWKMSTMYSQFVLGLSCTCCSSVVPSPLLFLLYIPVLPLVLSCTSRVPLPLPKPASEGIENIPKYAF